jgi:hypothetical protein
MVMRNYHKKKGTYGFIIKKKKKEKREKKRMLVTCISKPVITSFFSLQHVLCLLYKSIYTHSQNLKDKII